MEKKCFDVEQYIKGDWYGKLRSFEYFKCVTTDGYIVVWPDGQDICPDKPRSRNQRYVKK